MDGYYSSPEARGESFSCGEHFLQVGYLNRQRTCTMHVNGETYVPSAVPDVRAYQLRLHQVALWKGVWGVLAGKPLKLFNTPYYNRTSV